MTKRAKHALAAFMNDEPGQDVIEYALVAALIGMGAMIALNSFSGKIATAFNVVGNNLANSI